MSFKEGDREATQFKPGQSGNPAGRPKGTKSFKTRLLEMAEQEITAEDISGKQIKTTVGEAVAMALYGKAIKKDLNAIRMVMEHTEDKSLTVKGDPSNPLEINSTISDARKTVFGMLELAAKARASHRTFEDELDSNS